MDMLYCQKICKILIQLVDVVYVQDFQDCFDAECDVQGGELADDNSVPNGDEPVYIGCSLTKGQLVTLLFALFLRHCCSLAAMSDIIAIFNALVPGCVPHNIYFWRKFVQPNVANKIETHVYCDCCGDYLGKVNEQSGTLLCVGCNSTNSCRDLIKKGCSFLLYPLCEQLQNLFQKTDISSVLMTSSCDNTIHDVVDGKEYRKLRVHFPESLSVTCNTDGVPLFASSNESLWPVYFTINELPVHLRHKTMMLCALWKGFCKPRIDVLFKPIIESLEHLSTIGFSWQQAANCIKTKVYLCIVTCDSVARPLLQNMKQFNGNYGCSFCFNPGFVVTKGKGHVRCYIDCANAKERTQEEVLEHAQSAITTGKSVFGIKGPSLFALLPCFNLVTGYIPDYMHCVLLGVVRQFVCLWFDSTSHTKQYYLGRHVEEVDRVMLSLKPPSTIKRLPRSITCRKFWKASEWRNFLLFHSYPSVKLFMPKQFLHHWLLLMFGIFKLMLVPITRDSLLKADQALNKFVRLVKDLYGEEHVTFNVHLLTHLTSSVANWGPLWSNSSFLFEDANGKLKTFFNGTSGVTHQIFSAFIGASFLKDLTNRYLSTAATAAPALLNQITNLAYICKNFLRIDDDIVCLGIGIYKALNCAETLALQTLLINRSWLRNDVGLLTFNRVVVKGMLLHTEAYSENIKINDSSVLLNTAKQSFCIVTFAVVNIYSPDGSAISEKELICFGYMYNEVIVTVFDKDTDANILIPKKGSVDRRNMVAVFAKDICSKLYVVKDYSDQKYIVPVPRFELD